jgi:hypothetical protein
MLIPIAQAKAHIHREPSYPDNQILPYLAAAESKAAQFLNRRIFADQDELDAALATVPGALTTAGAAYAAALATSGSEVDQLLRNVLIDNAARIYQAAQSEARQTLAGIVINDQIRAAILVIFERLYAERGEAPMPGGSEYLLWDYRVGLGV